MDFVQLVFFGLNVALNCFKDTFVVPQSLLQLLLLLVVLIKFHHSLRLQMVKLLHSCGVALLWVGNRLLFREESGLFNDLSLRLIGYQHLSCLLVVGESLSQIILIDSFDFRLLLPGWRDLHRLNSSLHSHISTLVCRLLHTIFFVMHQTVLRSQLV